MSAVKRNTRPSSDWLCIDCGYVMGTVIGGELKPAGDVKEVRTNGPNLVLTCPTCGFVKQWYTSDPVVRAVYQLVNAISEVAAQAMIEQMSKAVHQYKD